MKVKVLTSLALLISAVCAVAQAANGNLQIHHMDIGQGDAAVLISPKGQVVLFDGGKDIAGIKNCDAVTDYLDQLGVKQIDYIFVSHYHTDHIGCIPAILKQFPLTGASYDRGQSYTTTYYTNYVNAVGSHRKTVTLGQTLTLDGNAVPVTLTVDSLNGTYPGGNVATTNENDLSVSVLVSFGTFREEIGGDLSGEKTADYQDIESGEAPAIGLVDVYKVHHHCSAYSTNDTWLKDTQPTIAVISTGDGNDYGHPNGACLARLHGASLQKVYWTEKGNGAAPQAGDVVAGDVVIEVAPNANSYTVAYNNGSAVDTYQIKAAPPSTEPRYAYSVKGKLYYYIDCPAVKRISKANLRTSVDPPPGKQPAACVKEGQ